MSDDLQKKMRRKLERDFVGRESVDDAYVWDKHENFNVFAERRDFIKDEEEAEENKLSALNELIKKREFAIA